MRKKDQRFTALYAAPGFFRPKPGEPEEDETKEALTSGVYSAPEPPAAPFMCVYAGPDWFAGKKGDGAGAFAPTEPTEPAETAPAETAETAPAEYPENYAEEGSSAPFMEVYAGPDQFSANEPEEPSEPELEEPAPEEPAEAAHEETEEERIARLVEQYKNDPPGICGLVQADPEALKRNTGFMNMGMGMGIGANPRFCPECGTKATPGDKFCRQCGSKLI